MPNIKMIARKAGVSISTVSRVMNGSKPVSPELQKRVYDAVKQMDYKPNSIARSLILNKTNLIGVVVPDVSNSFHAQLLSGIESFAAQAEYGVIICNVYRNLDKKQKYFNLMLERHVDGIILLHDNTLEELAAFQKISSTPLLFASVPVKGANIPFVGIDEVKAAYDAVSHLISKGHRDIGLIYGECYALGALRKEGYSNALKEHGIPIREEFMVQRSSSVECGYQAMERLLKLDHYPSAVFCVSDEIAIGALDCALDRGLKVPEDISLIGFDDIDLSQVVRPKLTTIHQPINEIGKEAAKLLIDIIQKRGKPAVKNENCELASELQLRIILNHSLVERETVKEKA
jgi:LacI family transcriptional regulator